MASIEELYRRYAQDIYRFAFWLCGTSRCDRDAGTAQLGWLLYDEAQPTCHGLVTTDRRLLQTAATQPEGVT
jgi:hypothetical protein